MKNILVDIELQNLSLLIPTYTIVDNKYELKQYILNYTFTKKDRTELFNFFKNNKVWLFKEGKFLDALMSDNNFLDNNFNLSLAEIRNLKKQFSSNKNGLPVTYFNDCAFYKTYNLIPAPTGDLKVLGFMLNNNIKQVYSTFGSYEDAVKYCEVNIKLMFEVYKYAVLDKKDINAIKSINCCGLIVNVNGTGLFSPRLLNEYGMWINSNYYYIKLNNPETENIDLKSVIRKIIYENKFDKQTQTYLILTEVKKHGELI